MKFSKTHEWVNVEGQSAHIGVSNFAQKELGDVVYVELPQVGHALKAGDEVVVLESTKAAVDIYSPVSGTITAINEKLRNNPELINQSAEKEGWLFQIALEDPKELHSLMDENTYRSTIA